MGLITEFSGQHAFLSNFFPAPVRYNGVVYTTAEHAYQASKCIDNAEHDKILRVNSPGSAKRLGRTVTLRPDWEEVKLDIMYEIVNEKFLQNKELGAKLLKTGRKKLIEGNNWGDYFWGMCNGVGENHLGEILMRVRRQIRNAKVNKWTNVR